MVLLSAVVVMAADIETQFTCPVCRIDYPSIVASDTFDQLAIDGQPLGTVFLPLPECPLCGGVFGNISLSSNELKKLQDFVWNTSQQSDRKTDSRVRFARLLEHIERDAREIGLAWLQAAWANSDKPQTARECREKSLGFFQDYLASPDSESEYLFDISLKIADILRQLQRFEDAEQWLLKMHNDKRFQQAWYPMLINHTLSLVREGNFMPAFLPAGNRLHNAIASNDITALQAAVSEKPLLNEINTQGLTPLILAISLDNDTAARLLLEAGADSTQRDTRGNSPLHIAAQRNNRNLLPLLLESSKNPDPVNQAGQTPLHVAIETLNPQIAGMMINAGASPTRKDARGNNLLHMICHRNNPQYEKILEIMLKRVGDVNLRNHDGMTPLHIAAAHGSANMLKLLIQAGAKIDARITDGSSALFFCQPGLIPDLLELGADIDLKNNDGLSAFVNARLTGDKARIAAFKKTGRFGRPARIFEIAQGSKSVFELAAAGKSEDLAKILDKDPTQRDAKNLELGETPSHAAAAAGNAANTRLLIDKGAAVDATNDFLRTPLHYAAIMGHYEVVKLLCEAKANIHALDARGTTPLHDAAAAGHRRIYDYLIHLGASDSTLDNQGRSAAELLADGEN
ncbi:MAG: hypothetical protein GQF41_1100 [Candidatus Rifleibacterium amylolyticum]|nr:MAG: hypothetical protein GQF41_1100 [Candidatus Rifleibacterium amylolyticum]